MKLAQNSWPLPTRSSTFGPLALAAFLAAAPNAAADEPRAEPPPCVATGKEDPRMASFDRMMQEFLKKHEAPGAALAVTDRGRLVYARGYGYADLEAREPVAPTSLFRIASISKPITAVAVLQLVEQKRLDLDDRVLDILDQYAPHLEDGAEFDGRQREITIRQLLQHRGGWDRDASFDPMFQSVRFAKLLDVPPPAGPETIIRVMLGRKLDFAPGERYAYSNYGYCLLGRVIETVTGQSYEHYVQENVLAPLGIRSMRIGRSREDGRQPGEVRYYDPNVIESVFADDLGQPTPAPYGGWHLEAMDAHGGWIASAVDLAKFACAFADPQACKILESASIAAMHERPPGEAGYDESGSPKDVYYSLGWMNRVVSDGKVNHWHTGSLDGAASILIRRHDGKNFVALLNARVGPHASHLAREIDPLLHRAAGEVDRWPQHDLFAD